MADAAAAPVWTAAFGSAPAVYLHDVAAALAHSLGASTGLSAADVACILRWTALPLELSDVMTSAASSPLATLRRDDYLLWLGRFGADGEAAALRHAADLFVRGPAHALVVRAWFHGYTVPSADVAILALKGQRPGTYLVRTSRTRRGCFTASYVLAKGDIVHTHIAHVAGGYVIDGDATVVPTLSGLIARYGSLFAFPLLSPLVAASAAAGADAVAAPAAVGAAAAVTGVVPPTLPHVTAPAPPSPAARGAGVFPGHAGPSGAVSASSSPLATAPFASAPAATAAPPGGRPSDIFISYSWKHQPLVLRIRDALAAAGYRVWVDVNDMRVSYGMEMAAAIAGTRCVLVCASSAYIASDNCTVEANMTFEHRKKRKIPVIIARMEKDFEPGTCVHTLATLAAGHLYCDFAQCNTTAALGEDDRDHFAAAMGEVLKRLREGGVHPSEAPAAASAMAAPSYVPAAAAAATPLSHSAAAPLVGGAAAAGGNVHEARHPARLAAESVTDGESPSTMVGSMARSPAAAMDAARGAAVLAAAPGAPSVRVVDVFADDSGSTARPPAAAADAARAATVATGASAARTVRVVDVFGDFGGESHADVPLKR